VRRTPESSRMLVFNHSLQHTCEEWNHQPKRRRRRSAVPQDKTILSFWLSSSCRPGAGRCRYVDLERMNASDQPYPQLAPFHYSRENTRPVPYQEKLRILLPSCTLHQSQPEAIDLGKDFKCACRLNSILIQESMANPRYCPEKGLSSSHKTHVAQGLRLRVSTSGYSCRCSFSHQNETIMVPGLYLFASASVSRSSLMVHCNLIAQP